MKVLKIIGGLLALIGGIFIFIELVLNTSWLTLNTTMVAWIINIFIAGMAVLGGILAIGSKRGGNALMLVAGVLSAIFGFIYYMNPGEMISFVQFSFFSWTLGFGALYFNLFIGISLETILILVGGFCNFISIDNS